MPLSSVIVTKCSTVWNSNRSVSSPFYFCLHCTSLPLFDLIYHTLFEQERCHKMVWFDMLSLCTLDCYTLCSKQSLSSFSPVENTLTYISYIALAFSLVYMIHVRIQHKVLALKALTCTVHFWKRSNPSFIFCLPASHVLLIFCRSKLLWRCQAYSMCVCIIVCNSSFFAHMKEQASVLCCVLCGR